MNLDYLDFEQPIAELEAKIEALCDIKDQADIIEEMQALKAKSNALTTKIFSSLSDWEISQLARHPRRLYTLDYIDTVFDEFTELHGDRAYADDNAIVGGIAKLDGQPVMFIGQQKGRTTQDKLKYNFGMPRPEGYRKALRLMKMAENSRCQLLPLSTHRVLTQVLARKSAVNQRLLLVTCMRCQR